MLSSIKLSGTESNRVTILNSHSSKLEITSVSVDMKRLIIARILQESFRGNYRLDLIKGMLMHRKPFYFAFLLFGELCQWSKDVRSTTKHILIEDNASDEGTKFFDSSGSVKLQDCTDLLLPRFETKASKPIAKPFCFLDGPFTVQWI